MANQATMVPIELPNGSLIYAKVAAGPKTGLASREQLVADHELSLPKHKIDGIMKSIEGMAGAMAELIEKVAPHEATVEFGIEIGSDSGGLTALLVKGTAKADLKVSLTWKRNDQ